MGNLPDQEVQRRQAGNLREGSCGNAEDDPACIPDRRKGSQDVWVYSPPQGDSGWVFDEIVGDAGTIKSKLSREDEIFTAEQMKWMSSALQVARKISEDARAKLGAFFGASQTTRDKLQHWFLDEGCGEAELKAAMAKLSAGFKKIASACGASTLVFADYPDWRAQRDDFYGAAIRGGEGGGFPVVYLEGAFTRLTGNTGKTWLCAETIIHELSHLEISTQDHRYDDAGLKPNRAVFPYAKAIDNADSWGYFALDLAGYLSRADHDRTWKKLKTWTDQTPRGSVRPRSLRFASVIRSSKRCIGAGSGASDRTAAISAP